MKCAEFFYNYSEAVKFMNNLHKGANAEVVETIDEDIDETVYVVYYNPPKMK